MNMVIPRGRSTPEAIRSSMSGDPAPCRIGTSTSLLRWRQDGLESYPIRGLEANANAQGVVALAEDSTGSILVGIARNGPGLGLQRFNNGKMTPVTAPGFDGSTLDVLSLLVDRHKAVWVGTANNGIYRIYGGRTEHLSI